MRKKEIIWIGLLVLLCGVYARYFTTWFVHRQITINASPRPSRQADAAVYPIFFSWNEDLRLTRVKVIPWEGDNFNPKGHPVWVWFPTATPSPSGPSTMDNTSRA